MPQRTPLPILPLLMMLCASGCAPAPVAEPVSDTALCAGLARALADHAAALADDAGPAALRSGVYLITLIDAGCAGQADLPLDGPAR